MKVRLLAVGPVIFLTLFSSEENTLPAGKFQKGSAQPAAAFCCVQATQFFKLHEFKSCLLHSVNLVTFCSGSKAQFFLHAPRAWSCDSSCHAAATHFFLNPAQVAIAS
jgi:hypothetical protein